MDIIISNASGKPIYEQITVQIKSQILSGALTAGDALPSMRVLAKELRISVITTKRAYEELEHDGFIETVTGKGSFVARQNTEFLREDALRRVEQALENAVETADSMRSRGYGLPGRTAFSIYRFDDRDKATLAWLIFCGAYLISGWMADGAYFRYYPTVKTAAWTPMTVSFMLVYLALVLTPVILDRREDRQWKSLRSEI